ncbi:hypothetical protein HIM_03719 [Hirsutella minnesotensis 3608]|uniref:thioredoxin-dependent peroxiredoxin n=1 Tax=Hirsutella minnesotensis 3608 TaxID=1043627 RepID=A0A0F8A293_9HYPO|nr:hypothetical protein HIM_03719 [Hirsutella minnesotensis 3608]
MPVELRKRKAPQPPPAPAPATKRAGKGGAKKAAPKAATKKSPEQPAKKASEEVADKLPDGEADKKSSEEPAAKDAKDEPARDGDAAKSKDKKSDKKTDKVAVGDVIDLDGFGAEIQTNTGDKTTLKKLLDDSKSGVVLFTYPKASTPGCTNQACLFRDSYESLTADGLAIYGLSTDSPKANTTFKEKQNLPYPLLCDPQATLIAAIGFKKSPKGTQRGVFAVDKEGKVLVAEPGGPAATVERIKALVEELAK